MSVCCLRTACFSSHSPQRLLYLISKENRELISNRMVAGRLLILVIGGRCCIKVTQISLMTREYLTHVL